MSRPDSEHPGAEVIALPTAAPSPPGPSGVVEHVDEVADGELVDDAPAGTGLAPAGDGAGEVELPPVLPVWLSSREAFAAQARAVRRRAVHKAGFHAVRSPVYATRGVWRTTRGTLILTGAVVGYLSANDEYKPLIRAEKEVGQRAEALAHRHEQSEERAKRLKLSGLVLAGVLVTVGGVTVWLGPAALWMIATVYAVAAYLVGRPADARPMIDSPDLPVRLELAPEHLNEAFRAAALLKEEASLTLCAPILREGDGWAAVVDLPRGGGKTAKDVLARRDTIAAELGVDEIQLIMQRVRASAGGHAGRLSMWVADDDPYIGPPVASPLVDMEEFSVWKPIPYGRDARGHRVAFEIIWQSMFFGGLPRRGKTFSQRVLTAAGLLDPWVRHYTADFKGGADWKAMRKVAHRIVLGAEDADVDTFKSMLVELLTEMESRFKKLRDLPTSICPEGKLTPQISRKFNMPVTFITVDELQELFTAVDDKTREQIIDWLCRLARRGPAAGFICNFASQRPDSKSVPTKLREIITIRYATQVIDRASSDMVLGKGKAAQGADASMLSEEHQGVGVLVTGPSNFTVVKVDFLDAPEFEAVCTRGRALRIQHGQLTGDAVDDVHAVADDAGVMIHPLVTDVLDVMRSCDRMFSEDILNGLVNLDEDAYGDWDASRLARELETTGVERSAKQVKISGVNRAGYRKADIEAAVPVDIFTRPDETEEEPATPDSFDNSDEDPADPGDEPDPAPG